MIISQHRNYQESLVTIVTTIYWGVSLFVCYLSDLQKDGTFLSMEMSFTSCTSIIQTAAIGESPSKVARKHSNKNQLQISGELVNCNIIVHRCRTSNHLQFCTKEHITNKQAFVLKDNHRLEWNIFCSYGSNFQADKFTARCFSGTQTAYGNYSYGKGGN